VLPVLRQHFTYTWNNYKWHTW